MHSNLLWCAHLMNRKVESTIPSQKYCCGHSELFGHFLNEGIGKNITHPWSPPSTWNRNNSRSSRMIVKLRSGDIFSTCFLTQIWCWNPYEFFTTYSRGMTQLVYSLFISSICSSANSKSRLSYYFSTFMRWNSKKTKIIHWISQENYESRWFSWWRWF